MSPSSRLPLRPLQALLCAGLLAVSAAAQQGPMLELSGTNAGDNFGFSVAALGDLDGDGIGDYAVGAFLHQGRGMVRVFSGQSGAPFFTHFGDNRNDQFGYSVASAGDVDADGFDDLIAGANFGNYARVFSGRTGDVLHTLLGAQGGELFGQAVAGAGDVDQDGHADLIVGAPGSDASVTDAGLATVFSGANGGVIRTLPGAGIGTEFGYCLAPAGLVDQDLVPDVIIGTSSGSNLAQVHSGADGALIHSFVGDSNLDWFGTAVAGIGDVDGDGRADLAVGASQALLGRGYVRIFSGATGAVIRTLNGQSSLDLFGWSVASAGDLDGDGRGDVVVGAPFGEGPQGQFNVGSAQVFSGANGSFLTAFYGVETDGACAWSVDGGPCRNLIAGAPSAAGAGQAKVFDSFQTPGWTSYCLTTPNSAGAGAEIGASGTTRVSANDLFLVTTGCPPNTFGLYFYGRNAAEVPFGNGIRCVGNPFFRRPAVPTGPGGVATYYFDLNLLTPAGAVGPGEVWRFQCWYRDLAAGGALFDFSDGLRVLFCP